MSAADWFKSLNRKAPAANKEKHHGNKRAAIPLMKQQRQQDERRANKRELNKQLGLDDEGDEE